MGFQALSWQLPTSSSFRPGGNIASSSKPQRHNKRFMWFAIKGYYKSVLNCHKWKRLGHGEY